MDIVGTPKNPIPLGASTGYIEVRKGIRLRFASWQSVLRERRGTVCIFPGRAEFIEKYFEVVGELRRRGYSDLTLIGHSTGANKIAVYVDGHRYLDYVQSWGALLFGHARAVRLELRLSLL